MNVKQSASAVASTSACATGTFNRLLFSTPTSLFSLTKAGAGILNQLSIAYALRPRLRSRLTLGGRTFPRKPWVYGGQESNLAYRYSCLHSHSSTLHSCLRSCFNAPTTLPYHATQSKSGDIQSFGIPLIANHFRRENTR